MSNYFAALSEGILKKSESKEWTIAKSEWKLTEVYRQDDEPTACLCGHFPVIETCVLVNVRNGSLVEVGNVCVKKFMGQDFTNIFSGLKRITSDDKKSPGKELIAFAIEKNWLTDWERGFSLDTVSKRKLSPKQAEYRSRINQKILTKIKKD